MSKNEDHQSEKKEILEDKGQKHDKQHQTGQKGADKERHKHDKFIMITISGQDMTESIFGEEKAEDLRNKVERTN